MPSIYGLTGGVNTKQKTLQTLLGGVNTKMKTGYALVNGVNSKVFSGNPTCTVTLSTLYQKGGFGDSTLSGNNLHVGNHVQKTDSSTLSVSNTELRIVFSDNISYTSLSSVINNISLFAYSYIKPPTTSTSASIYLWDLINSQYFRLWDPTFPLPETTIYAPSPLTANQSFSGISNTFKISFSVVTDSQSLYADVHMLSLADILLSDISICGVPLVLT